MKMSITKQIFYAMILGILLGVFLNHFYVPGSVEILQWSQNLTLLSTIFLRLIKMIIGPLVFSVLTVGIAKLGDFKLVGRIGVKTLIFFYLSTILSLLTGLFIVNIFRPGEVMHISLPSGFDIENLGNAGAHATQTLHMKLETFITHLIPESFFGAMASNEVLQIVIFSIFFGIALASIKEKGRPVVSGLDSLTHLMFKMVHYIMCFAPLGVFGAISSTVAKEGLGIFKGYAYLMLCFYCGLIFFIIVILGGICLLMKIPFWRLLHKLQDAILISFSTACSESSLPLQIEQLEEFGYPERIIGFVLPLGYSFNLAGSMMYMTFATAFVAQAYGVPLTLNQQITMLLTLLVTSKGVAGVPRASLVIVAGTMSLFNLPTEGLALLLGIDHFLDMGRSATSVIGNAVATAVISKWETGPKNSIKNLV